MSLLIPLIALGGIYVASAKWREKQQQPQHETEEGFLPNTNIPDTNYPNEDKYGVKDLDRTTTLSVANKYKGDGTYTDKYFLPMVSPPDNMGTKKNDPNATPFTNLLGQKVGNDYFAHNNMVPFFGSKMHNTDVNRPGATETIMDYKAGSGSQSIAKREMAAIFEPTTNLNWQHGMPNTSDFMQERMIPPTRMANIQPFEKIQVGPGLGMNGGSEGKGGYNSGLFARDLHQPKNVDELRIRPKATEMFMGGYEGVAASHIKNMGQLGIVEKRSPETAFEVQPHQWIVTTGAHLGPTVHGVQVDRDPTQRSDTHSSYVGGAGAPVSETYIDSVHMETHRQGESLPALPLGGVSMGDHQPAHDGDYNAHTFHLDENNRTTTKSTGDFLGIVSGVVNAAVAPLLDALRPGRRELIASNLRPYSNPKPSYGAAYVSDPRNKAPTTTKETTLYSYDNFAVNHHGSGQGRNGYENADINLRPTLRTATSHEVDYVGTAKSNFPHSTNFHDAYTTAPRIQNKRVSMEGWMASGNAKELNHEVNLSRVNERREQDLMVSRDMVPTLPYQSPSAGLMGFEQIDSMGHDTSKLSVAEQQMMMNNNRFDPNLLLSQLNKNPYALPSINTNKTTTTSNMML